VLRADADVDEKLNIEVKREFLELACDERGRLRYKDRSSGVVFVLELSWEHPHRIRKYGSIHKLQRICR
jgi:hypothetical protein